MLILVGIGLALFVLRIFGIGWLQYGWVLALSICLVAFGLYLVRHSETSKSKLRHWQSPLAFASVGDASYTSECQ